MVHSSTWVSMVRQLGEALAARLRMPMQQEHTDLKKWRQLGLKEAPSIKDFQQQHFLYRLLVDTSFALAAFRSFQLDPQEILGRQIFPERLLQPSFCHEITFNLTDRLHSRPLVVIAKLMKKYKDTTLTAYLGDGSPILIPKSYFNLLLLPELSQFQRGTLVKWVAQGPQATQLLNDLNFVNQNHWADIDSSGVVRKG